jgi:hypothetical protein
MLVIESIAGYYEAEEVAFGVVYKWCPERVVIECDCGERQAFTGLGLSAPNAARTTLTRFGRSWLPYDWRIRTSDLGATRGVARRLLYFFEERSGKQRSARGSYQEVNDGYGN